MRFARRCAAIVCVLLLGTWAVAWAHATLVSAEPAAGSHLAASPPRVRLVFNEPLEPELAHFALYAAGGRVTQLAVAGDPHDVHALVARLAPDVVLGAGAYRLLWHIVSADGHPVDGTLTFSVGGRDAGLGSSGRLDSIPVPELRVPNPDSVATWGPVAAGAPLVPAVLRGLAVGALMALAGLLAFVAWPCAAAAPSAATRLAARLALAAPVLVALHLAAWLVNASPDHRLTSDWVGSALGSDVGRVELWRLGLALLVPWALLLARRARLATLTAFAAVLVSGATGHAVAIVPLVAVPAKALHLVAVAAWLGGLLWLIACTRAESPAVRSQARRVSAVALVAVIVVALTGVVETLLFLPSPLDVVRSAYGVVVLAKVAGLAALVAFGAHHRYRVVPRLDDATDVPAVRRFGVTLRRETALLALVVLLGGLLAYVPPPARPTPTPSIDAH